MPGEINPLGAKRIELRSKNGRPQLFDPNIGAKGEFVGQPYATKKDAAQELRRLNAIRDKRASRAGNPFKNAIG